MYIYHALIDALCAHMTHINLNTIFCTHVEHSPTIFFYKLCFLVLILTEIREGHFLQLGRWGCIHRCSFGLRLWLSERNHHFGKWFFYFDLFTFWIWFMYLFSVFLTDSVLVLICRFCCWCMYCVLTKMFRPNVSSMVDWVYKPVVCVFKFWDAEKTKKQTNKKTGPFKVLIQRKRTFQAFQKKSL